MLSNKVTPRRFRQERGIRTGFRDMPELTHNEADVEGRRLRSPHRYCLEDFSTKQKNENVLGAHRFMLHQYFCQFLLHHR